MSFLLIYKMNGMRNFSKSWFLHLSIEILPNKAQGLGTQQMHNLKGQGHGYNPTQALKKNLRKPRFNLHSETQMSIKEEEEIIEKLRLRVFLLGCSMLFFF